MFYLIFSVRRILFGSQCFPNKIDKCKSPCQAVFSLRSIFQNKLDSIIWPNISLKRKLFPPFPYPQGFHTLCSLQLLQSKHTEVVRTPPQNCSSLWPDLSRCKRINCNGNTNLFCTTHLPLQRLRCAYYYIIILNSCCHFLTGYMYLNNCYSWSKKVRIKLKAIPLETGGLSVAAKVVWV